MELVRGIRIMDHCDQNNLSTQERLDLFIKVCQAIQHAHQKGRKAGDRLLAPYLHFFADPWLSVERVKGIEPS